MSCQLEAKIGGLDDACTHPWSVNIQGAPDCQQNGSQPVASCARVHTFTISTLLHNTAHEHFQWTDILVGCCVHLASSQAVQTCEDSEEIICTQVSNTLPSHREQSNPQRTPQKFVTAKPEKKPLTGLSELNPKKQVFAGKSSE